MATVAGAPPLQSFTREGLRFDVRDEGPRTGEPVLLLHGFPETSASWQEVVPGLAEAGYRVLVPDQRGYSPGARPPGRGPYRMPELMGDVLALADQAGTERFHLVGHDWGAAVAWNVALHHPQRLRSLTALSVPHPGAFRHALLTSRQAARSWYMGFFQLPRLPELFIAAGGWQRFGDGLVRTGLPRRYADEYVRRLREPEALTGALNWYRGINPLRDGSPRPVRVPTMLIWGTRDKFCHSSGVHRTERYVQAPYRLEVLEGISHWIPEQAPERVVELLLSQFGAG